jgi:hypothetical protein
MVVAYFPIHPPTDAMVFCNCGVQSLWEDRAASSFSKAAGPAKVGGIRDKSFVL